jgi:hypothetical protein
MFRRHPDRRGGESRARYGGSATAPAEAGAPSGKEPFWTGDGEWWQREAAGGVNFKFGLQKLKTAIFGEIARKQELECAAAV